MSLYSYLGVGYHYWKLLRFCFKGLNVDCVSAPHAGGTLVCRHKPGKEEKSRFQENLLPVFPGKCSPDFTGKTMLERLMANYFCILTKVPGKLGSIREFAHYCLFHQLSESGQFAAGRKLSGDKILAVS